ncbi:MAG TPA: flavodoxin family protein, partial [Acetobacteraceae bacterium]|nr:flavodoxin family protein [Acetobacteraceae bacterium]
IAFHLGDGAIEPALTNIRRIGVVTTYGSPGWLLWYIGRIDRKLIGRGLRRLCARDCRVEWLSLTRMDARTRAECEAFVGRVRRHLSRW